MQDVKRCTSHVLEITFCVACFSATTLSVVPAVLSDRILSQTSLRASHVRVHADCLLGWAGGQFHLGE